MVRGSWEHRHAKIDMVKSAAAEAADIPGEGNPGVADAGAVGPGVDSMAVASCYTEEVAANCGMMEVAVNCCMEVAATVVDLFSTDQLVSKPHHDALSPGIVWLRWVWRIALVVALRWVALI